MIPGWILLLVSVAYVGLLFGVAWAGDRRPLYPTRAWLRPVVYSLALAVYCSSWTFYGAVGTAASNVWGYLPIYLGPIILFVFAWRILERLVLVGNAQSTVSIADFIGARYGRRQSLAALVTFIALVAVIPYIALQLKAVAMSIDVLTATPAEALGARSVFADPALYTALLLAVFAILFGTRQIDATEHHHGMMLAVALESLVKLVAFLALGAFAFAHLPGAESISERLLVSMRDFTTTELPTGFLAQTLLAFAAIICLPRQFQVAVVECEDVGDVRRSRWMFTGYLVLICIMVLPITAAGHAMFAGTDVAPDSWVLALPLAHESNALALAAYVGGFSAATGMVIVATVAMSTMVSNDLVMPMLWKSSLFSPEQRNPVGGVVLWVRRATMLVLVLLAFAYHRSAAGTGNLAAFGLLAFAAVAQFAPALIGGLYWRGASRQGVMAGLSLGFALWIYTLLLPTLTRAGWFGAEWLAYGPFNIHWLRPEGLFGLSGWDALTHGTFWSLLMNVGAFLIVSARNRPSFDERLRATPFLDPYAYRPPMSSVNWQGSVSVADLQSLASRIVGERHASRSFAEYIASRGEEQAGAANADRATVQFTERLLAASIGAASARMTLTTMLRGTGMELGEVVSMLDEASQELRFNREILSATLENISQAVSVVDPDMRLVAWNRRYQEMFDYPSGMLYVGRPVADLIRYNAEHGELGEGDIEAMVAKRVDYMRMGSAHVFERVRPNGQVIEMRGQPLPGGGYVTTYTDVTDYKRVEQALRDANDSLEARVILRTRELHDALEAQRSSRREAVAANESKTRYLAALSHDVLQPLNAARLFASALRSSAEPAEQSRLAERVDASLRAAEELLDGLLDISRLDAGALQPEVTAFDLDELLRGLAEQYAPLAADRGIEFRRCPTRLTVYSDRRMLRRVLQNFVGNALRYSRSGKVLMGCRRHGGRVEIEVWDTGPGIPEHHLRQIFDEFRRLDNPSPWGERGLGLGLSICQRISRMLAHPIRVRSWPGHGSVFSIRVPLVAQPPALPPVRRASPELSLSGLRVLCLDNDREILDGMEALLGRWGVDVVTAETVEQAMAAARAHQPEVILADYHLHDELDGLTALTALRGLCGQETPGALLTADGSDGVKRLARAAGFPVLTKPLKPASLRAFLAAQRRRSVVPG
ncbi:PAS domain-containing hybrid sensor histidine kinase/response regulator [Alkalisalibacterium limincola]|uniref:histidine kinase n=1 Tax=Alkalisalibacterium limincola TaxID=2699169 RepID=A0A5C8KPV2_9GAMM|nr:PAS domain-containing hybrid sensor histidine kinase/response regulator [Alkalisalibacterium limincola]TXK62259.1 hybrid sensor histidine kinase/response regulator [Alkalisalibacterium limincola]